MAVREKNDDIRGAVDYYLSSQVFQRYSDTLPGRKLPLRTMQRLKQVYCNSQK
jgi:hypothetical protein